MLVREITNKYVKNQAIIRTEAYSKMYDMNRNPLDVNLEYAFSWWDTPEGQDFWMFINKSKYLEAEQIIPLFKFPDSRSCKKLNFKISK